jgi:hypothetical protein
VVVCSAARGGARAAGCASHDPDPVEPAAARSVALIEPGPKDASSERPPMSIPRSTSTADASAPVVQPEVWTTCSTDPDCAISYLDPDTCCQDCKPRAITRAEQDAAKHRCAASTANCAPVDCASSPLMARCSDHACVLAHLALPRS